MFGPGVEKDGVTVNKPTHFTVDTTAAGTAPLDVTVRRPLTGGGRVSTLVWVLGLFQLGLLMYMPAGLKESLPTACFNLCLV